MLLFRRRNRCADYLSPRTDRCLHEHCLQHGRRYQSDHYSGRVELTAHHILEHRSRGIQQLGRQAGGLVTFFSDWRSDFDDSVCGGMQHFFAPQSLDPLWQPRPRARIAHAIDDHLGDDLQSVNYPSCQLWSLGGRTNLNAIISGSCDGYIDNYASHLKNWAQQYNDVFLIRLGHEMNITDAPWYSSDSGYPQRFVQAFRHVRDRFNAMGATNQYAVVCLVSQLPE